MLKAGDNFGRKGRMSIRSIVRSEGDVCDFGHEEGRLIQVQGSKDGGEKVYSCMIMIRDRRANAMWT